MSVISESEKSAMATAFIRTSAQALAATLSTVAVTVASVYSVITNPDPTFIVASVIAGFASPLLAGTVAALNIAANGVPSAYTSSSESKE